MKQKVMVGMSGGVDSSVAALLLKEAGYDVVGVTMCFSAAGGPLPDWQAGVAGGDIADGARRQASTQARRRPSCCGLEGIEDAKKAAHQIGIPHYVLNFGSELEERVIGDFVAEYASGRTPNPCVRCNQFLKFGSLLEKTRASGFSYFATGHFARTREEKGRWVLKKGVDTRRDQSYFLCLLPRRCLPRVIFPLGDKTKEEVRAIARKKGLYVAEKPASQEVCFIPGDYREFLKSRLPAASLREGEVVDAGGRLMGRHDGIFNYTIGQREGLGISAPHPLYVVELQEKQNRVVVGRKEDTFCRGFGADERHLLVKDAFERVARFSVKVRYNHTEAPSVVTPVGRRRLGVRFLVPQAAVTPGQFAVFYRKDTVVGAAKIMRPIDDRRR